MVFLTRSIGRLARPACRSIVAAARPGPRTARAAPFQNAFGSIRTLTAKREKVKVLLVLYDGKKHAEEVRCLSRAAWCIAPSSIALRSIAQFNHS
jgi:formate dehydrogenase